MYRDNANRKQAVKRNSKRKPLFFVLSFVMVAGVFFFVSMGNNKNKVLLSAISDDDAVVNGLPNDDDANRVYRRRLQVECIPQLNYRRLNYRELFCDSNYVQLSAARAGGIDPDELGEPAECEALVPIFSNSLYKVDEMYYSKPYLTPEAALLLDFISHRFSQNMERCYPLIGEHRIIVTSALRTHHSEKQLRRVNRNATDTSCHMYGTTFDLSAFRYEHVQSGHDTAVDACRQMLALTLYELRYEGLCYVKYERNSCFHITVRTTQYEGEDKSELRSYVNPGSPAYMYTKSAPRPKYVKSNTAEKHSKAGGKKKDKNNKKNNSKKVRKNNKEAVNDNSTSKPSTIHHGQTMTEREKISMEQFER